jgi:hypothetical protein
VNESNYHNWNKDFNSLEIIVGLYVSSYIKITPTSKFKSMQTLVNGDIPRRFVVEVELNQFSLIQTGFFEEKLSLIDLLLESYANDDFVEIFR